MENSEIKKNQVIRLYGFPLGHPNARVRIKKVYTNGDVWASNVNMPLQGSINKVFNKDHFEKLTTI